MNIHEEHQARRAMLQRLGLTYTYQREPIPDRGYVYESIRLITTRPDRIVVPQAPANAARPQGPSALDFALNAPAVALTAATLPAVPETLEASSPEPPPSSRPSALAFAEQPTNPIDDIINAFRLRNHIFLLKADKLFITNASTLTIEERALIQEHRPALVSRAQPWIEEQPSSMNVFLGTSSPPPPKDWKPDEPPCLDGIKDIVLNFATDGLDWAHGHRPVGVTVSTLDGQLTRFLPFRFRGGNLDEGTIKRWVEREVRDKHITNANMRFDMHQSREWGIDLEAQGCTFSDIMHTAALLDDHRKRFAIDLLAADYLPDEVLVPRLDESRHDEHEAYEVAAREVYTAQLVGRLRAVMYPMIDAQDLRVVHNLEDEVIPCVVEMEKNGAPIDMHLLDIYHQECTSKHDSLMWELSQELGFAFELTAAGWTRLLEHYHLPVPDSFAEGVLKAIKHPTVQKAQRAGQYGSLNSKIFSAYKRMIGPDGILRFELNQLRGEEKGTVSGRFSAGFIQQVPNHGNHYAAFGEELFPRRLYIPGSGAYLAADAAQIQYRIFAHHANNPQVLQGYKDDPRASFHRMIMKKIQPYKPDVIYENLKSMNFMIIFGGKLIKIAIMMGHITEPEGEQIRYARAWNTDPRLAQAREIQAIYAREMPEVDPLLRLASHLAMNKCDDYCNKTAESRMLHSKYPHRGFVRTVLGRRSRFPNNYKLHKAFCMIDQGSEGDIMKTKIVELHRERKHTGFLMRQTVHDEISGDAQEPDTLDKVSEILNRQSFPQLKVPILFDVHQGKTWADCK